MNASHVVVDTWDGYTWWRDADGNLFTYDSALAFAMVRNDERNIAEHRTFRVFRLEMGM